MKRITQNIAIALCSLGMSLAVCEVAARLILPPPMAVKVTSAALKPSEQPQQEVEGTDGSINSVLIWGGKHGVRLRPNVTGHIRNHTLSKQDVIIRTNSIGLRGGEVPPRQPGQLRILLIGDSIMFGDYVDETLTISSLLEAKLKSLGYSDVIVMNAGLPGMNFAEEYHHYQEVAKGADPDLVVVGMYLNDAQEAQKFYAKTLRFPFSASRFLTWFAQRFQLLDSSVLFSKVSLSSTSADWKEEFRAGRNLHSADYLGTRDGFDFEIYNASNDFGLAWNPVAWKQIAEIAKTFTEHVRQNNTKFATFILPVAMQVYAKQEILSTYPQEQFSKLFNSLKVPHFDLLPTLRERSSGFTRQEMFYDHCHYKAEGNQLVADTLADWLVKDGVLPSPQSK